MTQWWRRKLFKIDISINHTINHYLIVRPNVVQRVGQLSLPHVAISKTEINRTTNIKPMSSSYNTPWIKPKLVVSIYSNTETSLAMSFLAIWCRVVQSRDVSPHNFDGLAMSSLAFSVAPLQCLLLGYSKMHFYQTWKCLIPETFCFILRCLPAKVYLYAKLVDGLPLNLRKMGKNRVSMFDLIIRLSATHL